MEYLEGTKEDILVVKAQIETAIGIDNESVIKSYAVPIEGRDGWAIPIIFEVKKHLTQEQLSALVDTLPDGWAEDIGL